MPSSASNIQKGFQLLVAATFFVAAAPDMYGVHDCPYHGHGTERIQDESGPKQDLADGEHVGQAHDNHIEATHAEVAESIGADTSHTHQICYWHADCSASIETAPQLPAISVRLADPILQDFVERIDAEDRAWGPRHRLFELHLPNAPPTSI